MVNFLGTIQNQFNLTYDWAEEIGVTIHQRLTNRFQAAKKSADEVCQSMSQGCRDTANHARLQCQKTIAKIESFLSNHKEALFMVGCSTATAYFAPHLFFPVAIATIVFKIELARQLQKAADYYLKDEVNPCKLNPHYNQCVTSFDITLATIAAIDAIALGTIYLTNSWTVFLIPTLGGLVAGNCAAKWGMNISDFLVPV